VEERKLEAAQVHSPFVGDSRLLRPLIVAYQTLMHASTIIAGRHISSCLRETMMT